MGNKFVIAIFLCIFAVSAAAQDLDPTVEVRREYEGELVEVHKPVFEMAVPDSVTRFALDFDYSVFENPYRGSYEFAPYLLSMKPSALDNGESSFYLRAGAGYQAHPTLDLVWSPKFRSRGFNMDVYGVHRSFIGNYLAIEPIAGDAGEVLLTRTPKKEDGSHQWLGLDMLNKAGVVFRHDWEALALDYSAGYYGMMQSVPDWIRGYNAVDAGLSLKTKPESIESLVFDMDLDYRYGVDNVWESQLRENLGSLKMQVGPFMVKQHRMSLGLESDVASYTGAYELTGGSVSLLPRYVFFKDRFSVDLGVRISKMLTGDDVKEQYVYPDVSLSYAIAPDALKLYFKAKGGGEFQNYSSTVASDHFAFHTMPQGMLGYKIERVGLTMGFDGRITDKFSYNIRGGYANYASLRHYVVCAVAQPWSFMSYFGAQKWFAALDWALDVEGFRFDGTVSYDRYWDKDGEYDGGLGISGFALLKPAALTGEVSVEYSWKRRLTFGADCDFSGPMRGYYWEYQPGSDSIPMFEVDVPAYADLGVYAEYATARNISIWMRGGNLLNMTIQRTPLYAEKGVHFTLGICMNL